MSFTDQKPNIATEDDCHARWSGKPDGQNFRCYLCGHRFQPGDGWRFVYGGSKCTNFLTCSDCDGDDVLDRMIAHTNALYTQYWWVADWTNRTIAEEEKS